MKLSQQHLRVPTKLRANLQFRRDLLQRCQKDVYLRKAMIALCREDPLFFFNVFCWVYEPRPRFVNGTRLPTKIPFIAWPHQVPCIQEIIANLGIRDIGLEKSRGEGASWIAILVAMWDWRFNEMSAIGLVSKDEKTVDDVNDPDSLMWKCDFTLASIPGWMAGEKGRDWTRSVTNHVLKNNRNGSTISGYSCVANVGSGGRKKWFLMDELAKFPRPADEAAMASTQHVTECRLIVSTPLGNSGAYYDVMHQPSNICKLILDWKQNPTRNRGLYRWVNGRAVAVDESSNPLTQPYEGPSEKVLQTIGRLRRRGFKIEGRERSPWYDNECDRAQATPQNVAQELDRDYGGSAYRIFGEGFFTQADDTLLLPAMEGDLDFRDEKLDGIRFDRIDSGPMKLWFPLDSRGAPPLSHYTVGCDVSSGTAGSYTSNSTIVVLDLRSGEQVMEYASNSIAPMRFADLAIAVSKWFYDAYLCWEHNGPGASFTKQIINRAYPHIYHRRSMSRRGAVSKEAGWWTDDRTKEVMFQELQRAVLSMDFVVRSRDLRYECSQYIRKEGKITHALIHSAADDSKGASHGDRAIAACMAVQGRNDRPIHVDPNDHEEQHIPRGSMAEREHEHEQRLKEEQDEWDDGVFATDPYLSSLGVTAPDHDDW